MAVIQVTEDNFDEVVMKSKKPVLLDFYADWCGPCKMLSPVVDQISEEYADDYLVGKVNVDEQPGLALNYQVMSIPMLVTMNLGAFAGKSVGVISKAEILDMLKKAAEEK
jgi:thioredoxin 1